MFSVKDLSAINSLHVALSASQVGARLVKSIKRFDLVIVGPCQIILGCNHLDVSPHFSPIN